MVNKMPKFTLFVVVGAIQRDITSNIWPAVASMSAAGESSALGFA